MERGKQKNAHFRKRLSYIQNYRGSTEALVIKKRLKVPLDDRTDINLIALLTMQLSLGAPDLCSKGNNYRKLPKISPSMYKPLQI